MSDTTRSTHHMTFPQQLFMTLVVVALALLIWHTFQIILLIFAGVILAVFLRKTAEYITGKTRIPIKWTITIVILALLASLTVLGVFLAPGIAEQWGELSAQVPKTWQKIQENMSENAVGGWLLRRLPSPEQFLESFGGWMQKATSWLYSAVGAVAGIFIIFALGVYGAYDSAIFTHGVEKLVPKQKRARARRTLHAIGMTLYWWLIGRLFSMLVIGIFTFVGLWLMGIPLALTLGVFAAFMTFIPNIGPIISVIPALILAMGDTGGIHAGYVVALYIAIQTIESYLITPMVQRQAISMPPGLIISAQIIMGFIQGAIGIVLATPLVAAIIVITKLLYTEDVLDDHDIEIQAENGEA